MHPGRRAAPAAQGVSGARGARGQVVYSGRLFVVQEGGDGGRAGSSVGCEGGAGVGATETETEACLFSDMLLCCEAHEGGDAGAGLVARAIISLAAVHLDVAAGGEEDADSFALVQSEGGRERRCRLRAVSALEASVWVARVRQCLAEPAAHAAGAGGRAGGETAGSQSDASLGGAASTGSRRRAGSPGGSRGGGLGREVSQASDSLGEACLASERSWDAEAWSGGSCASASDGEGAGAPPPPPPPTGARPARRPEAQDTHRPPPVGGDTFAHDLARALAQLAARRSRAARGAAPNSPPLSDGGSRGAYGDSSPGESSPGSDWESDPRWVWGVAGVI